MPPKRLSKAPATVKKVHKHVKVPKSTHEDDRKKNKSSNIKESSSSGEGTSKMTLCTVPIVSTKPIRRQGRPPSGKSCVGSGKTREMSAKVRSSYRRSLDPSDNSNDSGICNFSEHHLEPHHHTLERLSWTGERAEAKRPKLDIKLENEEINDSYCFPESARSCEDNISLIRTAPVGTVPSLSIVSSTSTSPAKSGPRCTPLSNRQPSTGPVPLTTQLSSSSRYTDVSLTIIKQPEQQHRARYQTEGSRGAVKDRDGNGFPIVQLTGYHQPATLQVFIGTDVGKVSPHMFYQACKVSGKNSTPCHEKKIDGTCVIELQLDPAKEMFATCDCVGILKERNVDVEHRFPDQLGNRSKKKSTRCRMIFRTMITLGDGTQETLQVCSQPIVCTQPPGIPEICKKSLTSCPASGGLELFVIGKNFLKDTKVVFQLFEDGHVRWEQAVAPDKEYLQQTHFVCVVPPYRRPDITEPVSVRLCVVSSGKTSESHQFVYTPVNGSMPSVLIDPPTTQPTPFFWQSSLSKREQDLDMMPPPESSLVPMATRRPSISLPSSSEDHPSPLHALKQEYMDENSQCSTIEQERYRHLSESSLDVHHGDSNISMINENSMDMLNQSSMMSHMNENSNISVGNENSVEMMVRRNSVSQSSLTNDDSVDIISHRETVNRQVTSICENSMDCAHSNLSVVNEDSSCSTATQPAVTERTNIPQHTGLLTNHALEKVIDLRMKMPITPVDLVNTTATSITALQGFGIEHSTEPLPNQSGQSVENYLTRIEAKPSVVPFRNPTGLLMKNDLSTKLSQIISADSNVFQSQKLHMMPNQNCGMLNTCAMSHLSTNTTVSGRDPIFLSSSRPFLSSTITQNEAVNIVAKSESADIAEQSTREQTDTMASSTITTIATALERSIPTPINTERLDALVNSTVETHLSPTRNDTSPKDLLINNMALVTANDTVANSIITSQDVMLNPQTNLMVPPMINTRMASPQEMSNVHTSPNLTSEVILNSQISPSLMCQNTNGLQQEGLLTAPNLSLCQASTNVESALIPGSITPSQQPLMVPNTTQSSSEALSSLTSPISVTLAAEPEKALLLNAAVDFLETQQKLNEMETTTLPSTTTNNTLSQLQSSSNSFAQPFPTTMNSSINCKDQKSEYILPISVKDITSTVHSDKKNEDRMIPQSFTSLTENELINFINPSCFDQGNNSYH